MTVTSDMSQKLDCFQCKKPFLVIDQEETFLKENGWPLPIACPSCRQERRLKLRNPRQLQKTTCDKCGVEFIVSFERKDGDTVYCKEHWKEWYESSDHLVP